MYSSATRQARTLSHHFDVAGCLVEKELWVPRMQRIKTRGNGSSRCTLHDKRFATLLVTFTTLQKTFCKFVDQNHSIGCSEVKSDIEKQDGSQDRPQNSNKTAFILKSFPARFADRSCWIYIYSIMIKFLFVWAFGRAHRAVMSFAIRIAQIYSTYRQL